MKSSQRNVTNAQKTLIEGMVAKIIAEFSCEITTVERNDDGSVDFGLGQIIVDGLGQVCLWLPIDTARGRLMRLARALVGVEGWILYDHDVYVRRDNTISYGDDAWLAYAAELVTKYGNDGDQSRAETAEMAHP